MCLTKKPKRKLKLIFNITITVLIIILIIIIEKYFYIYKFFIIQQIKKDIVIQEAISLLNQNKGILAYQLLLKHEKTNVNAKKMLDLLSYGE